jgi:hypothetical protein
LRRSGALGYLERNVKALLPEALSSFAKPLVNVAISTVQGEWCGVLPQLCGGGRGGGGGGGGGGRDVGAIALRLLPKALSLSSKALPAVVRAAQSAYVSSQVQTLTGALAQGQVLLGALAIASMAQSELNAQRLLSEMRSHHQETLTAIRALGAQISTQLTSVMEMLERIEQKLDDQLKAKVDLAKECAANLTEPTSAVSINMLTNCLTKIQEARNSVTQRGYSPSLELSLLELELHARLLEPEEDQHPQHLQALWSAIARLPSPEALQGALAALRCREGAAPTPVVRREGLLAAPAPAEVDCVAQGSWLDAALAARLKPMQQQMRAELERHERFEERRRALGERLRGALALSTLDELNNFARPAEDRIEVESAERRARRWVHEHLPGIEGARAQTLKVRVSLISQLKERVLTLEGRSDLKLEHRAEQGRLVHSFELKPEAAGLAVDVALTYQGTLWQEWVARCRLELDDEALKQLSRQGEPLAGVLDCTQYDELLPQVLSYSIEARFEP